MGNDLDFKVFLFFSPEKIILSVNRKTDFKLIFKDEFFFDDNPNNLNFDRLNLFLNENIFKVEKILGSFIEKVLSISVKKQFKI